jgi:acetyl-CoA carboxylase biotin carboxyl carrier protein
MEFGKIKELIKLVDSSSLAFFELQSGNDHIKMDKSLVRGIADTNVSKPNTGIVNSVVDTTVIPAAAAKEKVENYITEEEEANTTGKEPIREDKNLSVITSPMVGTVYFSALPESTPFVQVGDTISKGKIICIIEAMKLMNEIESEFNGVVVECLAKDGEMVEYGQPLFKVKGE